MTNMVKSIIAATVIAVASSTAASAQSYLYYSVTTYGQQGPSQEVAVDDCMYAMGIMESRFTDTVGRTKVRFRDYQNDYTRIIVDTRQPGVASLSMTCYE